MRYEVKLTEQALKQMQETILYISKTLLEPETAKRWADYFYKEISSLDTMPTRHPLTMEEPWHTYGIRKMTAKNFLIYYLIDEERKQVSVTAVIYGGRDQRLALLDMEL